MFKYQRAPFLIMPRKSFKIKLMIIAAALFVIGGIFLFILNYEREIPLCKPVPFWSEGTPTSWDDAVKIIRGGQIGQGLIYHQDNLCVTLFLEDGRIVDTKEPNLNDVRKEIGACGDLCNKTEIYEISIVPWKEAVKILGS